MKIKETPAGESTVELTKNERNTVAEAGALMRRAAKASTDQATKTHSEAGAAAINSFLATVAPEPVAPAPASNTDAASSPELTTPEAAAKA